MPAADVSKDYYGVLRVPSGPLRGFPITLKEIKTSYHSLALELHPDKNGGDLQATEQFKLVQEAYEVLSDGALRTEYDRKRQTPKPEQPTASNKKRKAHPSAPAPTASAQFPFNFPDSSPELRPRPPPPPPTEMFNMSPQRTGPIHPQFDFSRFQLHHYYIIAGSTSKLCPTKFLHNFRVVREAARSSLREARLEINLRAIDLQIQPLNVRLQTRLAELRASKKWWETEAENLEDWYERHYARAKLVRA
jgi:curved DNA-binding protein CbpA